MNLCGVNFGGYLSQVPDNIFTTEHLDAFITEKDVEDIKNWGFNLIRLPVDFHLFEENSAPYKYREGRLKYIDNMIALTKKYSITVMFDLHKAPGHSFSSKERDKNDIWDKSAENRKRFLNIWEFISARYKNESHVIFEIINEPIAPKAGMWNELAADALEAIRKNAPDNYVVVESNMWGQAKTFPQLKKFDDDRIIYSFHDYDPILVTHQMAEWVPFNYFDIYRKYVDYPGRPEGVKEAIKKLKEKDEYFLTFLQDQDREYNKEEMKKVIKPVLEFRDKHKVPVFCGEFGCVAKANPRVRANWTRDIISIFREEEISYAYWNYKNMDFGIRDFTEKYKDSPNYDSDRLNKEILKILQDGIF